MHRHLTTRGVAIPAGAATLPGALSLPSGARGVVAFAHGSGSSRFSPRNREVAAALNARGHGTLLFDLLTAAEGAVDERTRALRFDIPLLGERLVAAVDWLAGSAPGEERPIGVFGASTGAAAALVAAAARPDVVRCPPARHRANPPGRRWQRCPGDRPEPRRPGANALPG
jgi:dienelactone hydrolase